MRAITLLSVAAFLLADQFGSQASVGGPMTSLTVLLVVMLVVGLYEARGRDPAIWATNVILALVGGFAALSLFGVVMEAV